MAIEFKAPTSRRAQLETLGVGQSAFFPVPAGRSLNWLQKIITAEFCQMAAASINYTQRKGLLVTDETEAPTLCTIVTRVN